MFQAEVLADSINPSGDRLLTVKATFPRFILAEVNTHCVLSRNSASSRAIPTERLLEMVEETPFIPETFNRRIKGMGVGDAFDPKDQKTAQNAWLRARDDALTHARKLMAIGIDKSRVNRLLEPFMWHTAIITATHWSNFFGLRAPEGDEVDINFGAQPEFQRIAILMREKMRESMPVLTDYGEWHLPLVYESDWEFESNPMSVLPRLSASRCARISYMREMDPEDLEKSLDRYSSLVDHYHMSPLEHPATPTQPDQARLNPGKLAGWTTLRQTIPNEWDGAQREPWDGRYRCP